MSNQILQQNQYMQGLDTTTYNCPYCHGDILESNKQTHEARCERMHRQRPSAMEEETIERVNSSRNLPYPVDNTQRPQVRDNIVDNDLIPCEICGNQIPMRLYTQHAEECLMRSETQAQAQRAQQRSQTQQQGQSRLGAQRQDRHMSVERERPQQQSQRGRDSTSEEAPSRGFMGFLRNLVRPIEDQRENEGQDMMRNIFSQPQPQTRTQQSNTGMPNRSNISRTMEIEDPRAQVSGATVIRTVEQGPFGSTIIRTRVVPTQQIGQIQQQRQPQQVMTSQMEEMGPLGLFFNLINGGGLFGMQQMSMDDLEGMLQEQSKGLDKETIDRMSIVKYEKEKYKNVDAEAKTCPICLEEFNDGDELRFLWCMHRFHRGCVDTWLEKNSNCPVCKKEFSEAENIGTS